jgi:zinc protease
MSVGHSALHTEDVATRRLDNGLCILALESHTSPTVATMLWYRVGSRNEASGETGRSHFLEHMLFKGTEKLQKGEIDALTMKHGGVNNAFTSYDFTAYYFTFASDRWSLALEIEADRMTGTRFDPAEFEAERNVVIEELKAGLDQPWGLLMQELNRTAFEAHPYRNPVIGWLEDVESAAVRDMEQYYREFYRPSNATLVLVGDFDQEAALDRASSAFSHLPMAAMPSMTVPQEPPQTEERRFEISWRSDVPRIAIAWHAPRIGHPDSYALQVLAAILSDGKASRLYQRLVEKDRTVTFVSAEYGEALEDTLFYIRAEGRGTAPIESIEAAIQDEVAEVSRNGVTLRELDRARHQIESRFVFSTERSLDQAMLLGQIRTLTTLDYIDRYLARIAGIDPHRIQEVATRYLTEGNRTVGWLVPREDDPVPEQSA